MTDNNILQNIVSLGYFCGIAQELERTGYRSYSLPFDWLITRDLPNILNIIANNFEYFLVNENLYQEDVPSHYFDPINKIHFFHDFAPTLPLDNQIDLVISKYQKRIIRLYDSIKKPTLFIRYCTGLDELTWIAEHQDFIKSVIKKYNTNNDILYIYSVCIPEGLSCKLENAVYVDPSPDDVVSRQCFTREVLLFINDHVCFNKWKKLRNIMRYKLNEQKKKYRFRKRKIISLFYKNEMPNYYRHNKQINDIRN